MYTWMCKCAQAYVCIHPHLVLLRNINPMDQLSQMYTRIRRCTHAYANVNRYM